MPIVHHRRPTRNQRRRKAHRANRSARSNRATTSVMVRGPRGTVMPDRTFTKLRYCKAFQLIGGTSTYAQFSLNSCYDVDPVGGSQQPMGFDQWMALYAKFKVHKSTCRFKMLNITTTPCMLITYPVVNVLAVPGVLLENDLEQRYSKNTSLTSVAAGGRAYLTNTVTVKKFNGGVAHLDTTFEGSDGAAPAINNYWNIVCYSADGVTAHNVQIMAEIDYYVEFFSPDKLPVSSS